MPRAFYGLMDGFLLRGGRFHPPQPFALALVRLRCRALLLFDLFAVREIFGHSCQQDSHRVSRVCAEGGGDLLAGPDHITCGRIGETLPALGANLPRLDSASRLPLLAELGGVMDIFSGLRMV